jgi:hypothetical protein
MLTSPPRCRAFVTVLGIALAAAAVGLQLRSAWRAWQASRGPAPAWYPRADLDAMEARCAGLRAYLDEQARDPRTPRGEVLGYQVDRVDEPWRWERDFFRMQYMLAPTPMTLLPHRQRVIMNYPSDELLRSELATGRYRLLWPESLPEAGRRDVDAGLALVIKVTP